MIARNDFAELKERYVNVFSKVQRNHRRFFHRKTVGNFITHLNNINNKNEREIIFNKINYFFDIIDENGYEPIDISESIELFHLYLLPIAEIYQLRLNFTPITNWRALIYLVPGTILLLFIFYKLDLYLLYFGLILTGIYVANKINKAVSGKVYGPGY